MEGRRSSAAALLLLAALVLAAGSSVAAAAAQGRPPSGKQRYMLVDIHVGRSKSRMAMREEDGLSVAGFANGKYQWFATLGSETLLPPGYRFRPDGGPGVEKLVGAMVTLTQRGRLWEH